MSVVAAPVPAPVGTWRVGSGRRRRGSSGSDDGPHWAPKWRRLMTLASAGGSGPPRSYDEFDHTVRGMLNRISAENACRLLPLDPSLRTLSESGDPREDSPPWWAARFAALMLVSYLQVIHTNRCARGLAMRSADNVLPAYLDAVAPLLARSPRLVDALTAWFARLLKLQDLSWPTARLVLLASHEQRERASLPASSLGRLPAELLKGRILRFLTPPVLPHSLARNFAGAGPLAGLCDCWDTEEGRRDAAAVLAHLLLFAPPASWPQLSAFAVCVIESALAGHHGHQESSVYLGASVLVAVAQRLESPPVEQAQSSEQSPFVPPSRRRTQQSDVHRRSDLSILNRMADLLEERVSEFVPASSPELELNGFVRTRAQAAIERARRACGKLRPVESAKQ
mmetsp:Transcript_53462/g.153400  ORF Transcript_53462/g.153400 Transcript_53462/m.153400 type:complete len:397 (+) Transcript_53462:80-1270(+)